MTARSDEGFTLIECLVALAVLAVASAGLIGAAQAHIDAVDGLRARTLAQWVAENRISELQLALPEARSPRATMLGQSFEITVHRKPTTDPDLALVEVLVRRQGHRQADARLRGILDTRTAAP